MPRIVEWHYDRAHDAIVVMTTTKAYTVLHLGRIDDAAEFPLVPAPTDLPKFLQPPPTLLEYELMLVFEPMLESKPLPVYDPLPEFEPMSLDLPPLKPIVPEVSVVMISSSDSPALALEPLPVSDSFELDPSKTTSTVTSRVSHHSSCNVRIFSNV